MDYYEKCLSWARVYGEGEYADASAQKQAAFANAVAYLVTGWSGGYGGPSVWEHAVSWALAGQGGENVKAGKLTVQTPDGSLPRAGGWEFDAACQFAAPIVFGELTDLHFRVYESEYCFDDDPEDLKALRGPTMGNQGDLN